jgi:hypothetical protein
MSGTRSRLRPLFLGFVVLLLDCASLDKLTPDTCGNGVVDPKTEDCDTFPNDPKDTVHARCGAPADGELACHLRCGLQTDGNNLACPDGWGCDTKQICRQPTGLFDDALGAVSGGARQLDIGDFDGDGRRDLVASGLRDRSASRLRVHYFDDAGGLAQVAVLPAAAVAPAVFDHDHNGRDAIAFGLVDAKGGGSLGVVSGLADRTFLPAVFPSATLPNVEATPVFVFAQLPNVLIPTAKDARDDSAILILQKDPTAGSVLRSLIGELGGSSRLNRMIPDGPAPTDVRGQIVAARVFDGSTTSACGEVVIAAQVAAGARVFVISPCRVVGTTGRSGWDSASPSGFLSLVVPETLGKRGVIVADLDEDHHLDILVDTTKGPFVSYGNDTGTGLADPVPWTPTIGLSPLPMPLAAGDLNLDGKTDLVFPTGVAVRASLSLGADAGVDAGVDAGPDRSAGTYVFVAADGQRIWTDAVIGHFNGDGYPDIVAATAGFPDLQAYAGSAPGSGTTVTSITTNGVVEAFVRGDFDGDHLDDIAIAESTALPTKSDLSIAYGRAFGALEPPQRIGTVDKSKGLAVVPHGAAPADLGSYSFYRAQTDAPQSTAFTVLGGSSERQPLAPLFFVETLSCTRTDDPCMPKRDSKPGDQNRQWLPFALAAGALGDPKNSAVLAYAAGVGGGGGPALGVWVADATTTGLGGLVAPKERRVLDGAGLPSDLYDQAAKTAKIVTTTRDVDNPPDKLDEVIVGVNAVNATDAVLMVVHPTRSSSDTQSTIPGARIGLAAQIEAIDLDGDGLRDAVVHFDLPAPGKIVVFLNDANGGFRVPGITLSLPPPAPGTTDPGAPVAFAGIAVRGAPPGSGPTQTNALAVLTEQSVVLATLRADKQGFDVTSLAPQVAKANIGGATAIAAGDFNGDGVQDIAIANNTITLMLQKRTAK